MNARARALTATAALTLGFGLAGSGTAHARPKPPDPKKTGCIFAGDSYSDGSVRAQQVKSSDGKSVTSNWKCVNGQWEEVHTDPERKGSAGAGPTRDGGRPRA